LKIVDIETILLEAKIDEKLVWSYNSTNKRHGLLVKVKTDKGIFGWGECHLSTRTVKFIIDNMLKPLLVGKNPLDIEQIWTYLYHRTKRFGQKGVIVIAIGAIDIALWDIAGKFYNVPLYQLLGGSLDNKVEAYATGLYFKEGSNQINELCNEAKGYIKDGFKAIKMKIGYSPNEDFQHVKAVRDAIGYNIRLMVDANYAYDPVTAINLGRKLEQLDIYWLEEPISSEDYEGYAEVTGALDMAIAGGESEYTHYGFQKLISKRAVDIVQPDIVTAGGLTVCRKVASMADAFGLQCIIHVWGSAIALSAAIHFTAAQTPLTPALNCPRPMVELDRTPNPLRDNLTIQRLNPQNGYLSLPNKNGLGIDINMNMVDKYRVE